MQGIYNYMPETNHVSRYIVLQLSVYTIYGAGKVTSHVKYFVLLS